MLRDYEKKLTVRSLLCACMYSTYCKRGQYAHHKQKMTSRRFTVLVKRIDLCYMKFGILTVYPRSFRKKFPTNTEQRPNEKCSKISHNLEVSAKMHSVEAKMHTPSYPLYN